MPAGIARRSLNFPVCLHESRVDPTGTPATDVSIWLRDSGLADYAEAFRAHHVDLEVLPWLTDEDLIALGISSIGHRRKLLRWSDASTAT